MVRYPQFSTQSHPLTENPIVPYPRKRPALAAATTALTLAFALAGLFPAYAQERKTVTDTKEEPSKDNPIPKEETAVTQHQQVLAGQTIHYTATAGNLLICKEDHDQIQKPYHSIFYIAYTEDGADAN